MEQLSLALPVPQDATTAPTLDSEGSVRHLRQDCHERFQGRIEA